MINHNYKKGDRIPFGFAQHGSMRSLIATESDGTCNGCYFEKKCCRGHNNRCGSLILIEVIDYGS